MKRIITLCILAAIFISVCSCNEQWIGTNHHDTLNPGAEVTDPESQQSMDTEVTTQPEHVILVDESLMTDQYTIHASEDGCYLVFFDEYQASESDKNAAMTNSIHFESVEDMVDCFRKNSFESHQRIIMQATFPETDKGIQICNLNRLYNIAKPAETEVKQVSLSGQYYKFSIAEEGMFDFGWVAYTNEESLNAVRDQMYVWSEGATVTRREETTFDGVPCRIVEYYNSTETYRDVYIEVEKDGKKMDIVMRYLLQDHREYPEQVPDVAPWQVLMFCEDNGVFYRVTIGEMLKTPTYEWLSSFGLTPYVPASDGNMATE